MNDSRDVHVTITSRTIVKAVFILIFIAAIYYIKDIVLVVLTAIVIASAVEPVAGWFVKRKIRRLPAVIGIYVILSLILAGFFIFFLPYIVSESMTYLNNVPDSINLGDLWSPIHDYSITSSDQAISTLSNKSFSIKEFIDSSKLTLAGTSAGVFKTASLIFGGALSFILIFVLSFYLAVREDGVGDFLKIVSPIRHHYHVIDLWKRSQMKIGYYMQGQLLLGLIVGVLVYFGLILLHIEHAFILGVVAALFEIIPIFGPILSAVPAVIIAVANGGAASGFLVIVLYLIIHQLENHLFYPLVVRKIVGISPIMVILSLIIGAKLAGFLGLILAVPIAAALMEYIADLEKNKKLQKEIL